MKIKYAAFLLVILSILTGCQDARTREKVKAAEELLREGAVAVESKFIDDCGAQLISEFNYFPAELTTPIGYLKSPLLDPFGKNGEVLHFINQPDHVNGSNYLIVSRGPDGDLDLSSWPHKEQYYAPLQLPPGTALLYKPDILSTKTATQEKSYAGFWTHHAQSYTLDGVEKTNRSVSVSTIPHSLERGSSVDPFVEYLVDHDISIYDPTNGLYSDGDIIRVRGGLLGSRVDAREP